VLGDARKYFTTCEITSSPVPMKYWNSSKDDDQGFVLGQVDKQPEHIAPAAIVIGIKRHRRPASELLQEFDSVLVRGSVCGEE
jgi:hypothetical protein